MFKTILITTGVAAVFAAIEYAYGLYRRPGVLTMQGLGASFLSLGVTLLIRATYTALIVLGLGTLWPSSRGALAGVSSWLVVVLYVLITDYGFYWLHRKCHEKAWLWRLHKPHHAPENLNIAVTSRENWLFQSMLPYAWLPPLLVWLGQSGAYVGGVAITVPIQFIVHSELRWDLYLQRNRFLRPLMWVVERVLTLPDVHHVHHGVGRHGDSMKNYGAALSIFDLLHGTLVIPHERQEGFGLPKGAPIEPWTEQLFWPFVRTKEKAAERLPSNEEAHAPADLAMAEAVIYTADGRAIVVS